MPCAQWRDRFNDLGVALSVVCDAAKSNVLALGYTGTYAFANVFLTRRVPLLCCCDRLGQCLVVLTRQVLHIPLSSRV